MKSIINSSRYLIFYLTLFLWLAFLPNGSCQNLDSLEQLLNLKQVTVKERISILDDLSWFYNSIDVSRSIEFGKKGEKLAREISDEKMAGTFLKNIGVAYYMDGVYDSAIVYLGEAKLIAEKQGDYRMLAAIHNAYANSFRKQSLYDETIDNYLTAARLLESKNDKSGLTLIYSNIGGVYQVMKNFDQALVYFKLAKKLAEETGDYDGLGSVYISLSDISLYQNKPLLESAEYAEKAIRFFKQTGNTLFENTALLTLAKVYSYHDDYFNAENLAKKASINAKNLGFDHNTAQAVALTSDIYFNQGRYGESVAAALAALATDSTDINITRSVYANLTVANAYLGYPDLSKRYMEKYREALDRYTNESFQNSISALDVKYQTEKKELKIATLERQRQLYIWLGVAGALILLMALAFAFIRYRLAVSKRNLAEKENQRLEQEKQLVAVQATLDGEAAERTRLARDLHDGLGSMLSAIKINLPQVQGGMLLEEVDVSRFQKAIGMLDDSIQELRRVAHHMMPETLLRYGLKVSLSDFCTAIPIAKFHYYGDEGRLPEKLEIMVYRCIHELVNNALKHAESNQINVQLVQELGRISFTVQDDGRGFDQNTMSEGMGLWNVRQRVEAFQGKIEIYSSKEGTEIHVEINL